MACLGGHPHPGRGSAAGYSGNLQARQGSVSRQGVAYNGLKDKLDNKMILYRPVGLKELELIYDSGMRAFPARLPQQPIFYPVLDLEYARQTASDWNVKNGQLAGYVTQFKVDDAAASKFEKHTVGGSQHQELWIPAEELEGFNQHIMGHIKVVEAHFGKAFQGFIPEAFGLGGKNAVEQFTLLANSYVYKRMEFYLEIKRNHKAVFLNYPFWQKYDFKNPGLKGKVIQAIREGWLTSFPKIPLVTPALEEVRPVKQIDPPSFAEPVHEEPPPVKKINLPSWVKSLEEDIKPAKQTGSRSLGRALPKPAIPIKKTNSPSLTNPPDEEDEPVKPADSQSLVDSFDEDSTLVNQTDSQSLVGDSDEEDVPVRPTDSHSLAHRVREEFPLVKPTDSYPLMNPVHEAPAPIKQTVSHFAQGVTLGLSGKIHEAIAELSRAAQEDPEDIVAHTSLGVAFHRLGEDDRALSCYEIALQIDPNDAEAHYFRANILYSQGNVRDAIAGYTIAMGLEPELIQAHQAPSPLDRLTDYSPALVEMYRIARPAQRILELTRLLDSNPRQANLFKERAAEYYRLWNYEQTIADYNSFLALEPDDADALHLRGVAYEQLRQFDRALQDYQRASALNPGLSDLYIERGITYGKTGNFRQSVASLNEAVRLAPRNPDGYFNRGTSHFQLGDFERAIEDFAMVMQLAPKDDAAYYWRGASNEAAGHQREAIADYRQFLMLSQDQNARAEVEQKLSRWGAGARNSLSNRSVVPDNSQKTNQIPSQAPDQPLDLHSLLLALGERAVRSIWFGSAVECFGEEAEELYSFTDHNQPMQGRDFLRISSGIRQTVAGDFTAFDADATSHWLFIHAWEGRGFYIETTDPKSRERLKTHFPAAEEVDGASPPYESLFIRI